MAKKGRPYQFQLDDRRETVRNFRDQGITPREIARKLKQRIEVIERDLSAIKNEDCGYEDEEEELLERFQQAIDEVAEKVEASVEKVKKRLKLDRPTIITRGPRRSNEQVSKRRAVVLELKYRGIRQREIARMLNTPLRTIQGDYASLRKRPYEIWKAIELTMRQRLSVFTNEELIEAFLGSPERKQELWERPQDEAVRFDLKWVRRRK